MACNPIWKGWMSRSLGFSEFEEGAVQQAEPTAPAEGARSAPSAVQ